MRGLTHTVGSRSRAVLALGCAVVLAIAASSGDARGAQGVAQAVLPRQLEAAACLPLLPCSTPTPAPTPAPTQPAPTLPNLPVTPGDGAPSYLETPEQTDAAPDDALAPPLLALWHRTLGADLNYPLIEGNLVFIGAGSAPTGAGGYLYALSLANGKTVWTRDISGSYEEVLPAYDGGRVMALNWDGLIHAYTASNGAPLWQTQLSTDWFDTPPVASNGSLYAMSNGNSQELAAVNESTGQVEWKVNPANEYGGTLAIDAARVYVANCGRLAAYSRADGHLVWQHPASCGSVSDTPGIAVFGTTVATGDGNGLERADTGNPIAPVAPVTGRVIAAHGVVVYDPPEHLLAVSATTGHVLWRRSVVSSIHPYAVAVGRDLFVADDHQIEALDLATGQPRGSVAADVGATDDEGTSQVEAMASAEGVLLAPSDGDLSAFISTFVPPPRKIAVRLATPVRTFGAAPSVIDGRLGAAFRAAGARPIELLANAFPYHHTTVAVHASSFADGGFTLRAAPTRDTLYRVATAGGSSGALAAIVYPKLGFHVGFDRATRMVIVTVSITADPAVRLAGHPGLLYITRPAQHAFVRLGSGAVTGGGGHETAAIRFPPVPHASPGAKIFFCIPHMSTLGLGLATVVDRDCGQETISSR